MTEHYRNSTHYFGYLNNKNPLNQFQYKQSLRQIVLFVYNLMKLTNRIQITAQKATYLIIYVLDYGFCPYNTSSQMVFKKNHDMMFAGHFIFPKVTKIITTMAP